MMLALSKTDVKVLTLLLQSRWEQELNLQLVTLRTREKSWGGLSEPAPRQMVAALSFGKVSESFSTFL